MSTSGQHDTLRRFVTSGAIVGAALVLFDGGRGLTGRAGGGAVGCGGEVVSTETDARGSGGLRPTHLREKLPPFVPVLEPGHRTVRYTGSLKPRPRQPPGLPNPPPRPRPPSSGPVPTGLPAPRPGPDLFVAMEDFEAGRFAQALRSSSLGAVVANPYVRFTVFAPDDDAWERFRVERPDLFEPGNAILLEEVLGQHVVAEELRAHETDSGVYEAIVPGAELHLDANGADLVIKTRTGDDAAVDRRSEVLAENGVALRADAVIVPAFTAWAHLRNLGFELFVAAVEATDQVDRFTDLDRPLTVLAPTDQAFRVMGWDLNRLHDPGYRTRVAAIVEAHVFEASYSSDELADQPREAADNALARFFEDPAQPLMVERLKDGSTAAVVLADQPFANGWIHAVDALLAY